MFQSPVKNTNEITNNANTICPFKFFEVGDINYQNQPTFCGKNGPSSAPDVFLDKNNTQLLQSLIIITQAERDNAVASASDCRYRGHEFEPTPCHITDVKANHKINLPSTDSRRAIVSYWWMYRYTCAHGIHVLLVLGGLRLRTVREAHWPAQYDL